MGYFLSLLLLPTAFMGLGLCVGQMESFVHTVFFNSKGENARPVCSFLLMLATTSPWYLAFISLHFVETRVLTVVSRKRLCQILMTCLAVGLFVGLDMRRKYFRRVALSYTALQFLASLIFSLMMSLTNDILNHEGGLSKRVIIWGYCVSFFYAGTGVGRTLLTGFVYYKVPLAYLQFTFVFLVLALLIVTIKRDVGTADKKLRELEASRKDVDREQESEKEKNKKLDASDAEGTSLTNGDEKRPTANFHPNIFVKLHHVVRVSQRLLVYMIVRRVPGMLVAWKVAPDYLLRLGFNPLMAFLGFPSFLLLSCPAGSVISATFIARKNLLPTLKTSSTAASLLLVPFIGLILNIKIIQKFFRMVGSFLILGESLSTGFETGFLIMYFLEINSRLPQSMRLCHIGLFAAMDRLSSHVIFTLLSAVSDNVGPFVSTAVLAASIAVNCVVCLRVR